MNAIAPRPERCLASALRAEPAPLPRVRWLSTPADAAALVGLLRAGYGETYAHRDLYDPARIEALWRRGRLVSLGQWSDGGGELVAHTGVWVHEVSDAVESGLSLVRPRVPRRDRVDDDALWCWLLARLRGCGVDWLHQHTTTLHPLAQRHALRHMRAAPTGLVPCYTRREKLVGLSRHADTMHALTMGTALTAPVAATSLWLPADAQGRWLGAVARGLGLQAAPAAPPAAPPAGSGVRGPGCRVSGWRDSGWRDSGWSTRRLETRRALGLSRVRLVRGGGDALEPMQGARWLVHVASDEPGLVAEAHAWLGARGFVAAGLRPSTRQPHDIVYLQPPPSVRTANGAARMRSQMQLAAGVCTDLVETWIEQCLRPTS